LLFNFNKVMNHVSCGMVVVLACMLQEIEELQDQMQQRKEEKAQLEVQIVQLEVQLLQQEVTHLQQLQASEEAVSGQCLGAAAKAVAALQAALQDLQQAMASPPEDSSAEEAGSAEAHPQQQEQEQQQPKWLSQTAAEMLSNMQTMLDQAQARARLIAARQSVGVQSDEALPSQWLAFLRSLPDAAVAQLLHLKAASEAILRIYMRGLSQLESTPSLQRHQGWGSGGAGGGVLSVFDLLMAHYTLPSQQQQQQPGRLSMQPYSAALWKDPQVCSCNVLLGWSLRGWCWSHCFTTDV
jgi:vacuolar-type H+-ATPase subunit I/STV1